MSATEPLAVPVFAGAPAALMLRLGDAPPIPLPTAFEGRAIRHGPTPRASSTPVKIDRPMLRGRLGRVTCSWRWAEDFVELIIDEEMMQPPKTVVAAARMLNARKLYPPAGSDQTRMLLCPACGIWTPRNQGEGGNETCFDCHLARMTPAQWTKLPSAHRFNQPRPIANVEADLAQGALRIRNRQELQTAAVSQISARPKWLCLKEHALALLKNADADGRSFRRPLYLRDDPRVSGGPIDVDGVMHDPYLGAIMLNVIAPEAA